MDSTEPSVGGRRLVLVGESNPYGSNDFALYHLPRGAAGNRLRIVLGLADHVYERIPKTNLCEGAWSAPAARRAAAEVMALGYEVVVCCGRKVAIAFGWPGEMFRAREVDQHPIVFPDIASSGRKTWMVFLPHPSGRCRVWQDVPDAVEKARAVMRERVPEIEWGSA